jgi:hypothetical protein
MSEHDPRLEGDTGHPQSKLTLLLYKRRLDAYPGLTKITGNFLGPRLDDPQLIYAMPDYLKELEDWHSDRGGLLLSDSGYRAYERFRDALTACISTHGEEPAYGEAKKELWQAKNQLLSTLHNTDLHLLYGFDNVDSTPTA